jgi:hypothetical protein
MSKTVEQMGNEILTACSGQPSTQAHEAMIIAMATHIGGLWFMSGLSHDDAQKAVREMANDVADHVQKNWGRIETHNAH